MPEDRMAEMMEPFTRMEGSRSRDTGGAGLGLALVRAIMAEHGGELRLANRPEGGLRASLVLPDHMGEAAKACIRLFTRLPAVRSEGRRGGEGCVGTWRVGWWRCYE